MANPTKQPVGLLERIRSAKSKKEVESLLLEGDSYKFVSPATVRRWKRAANEKFKKYK